MKTLLTDEDINLAKLISYARARRAHRSVLFTIERASEGYLEALDAAERMWRTILASPARAELLAAETAA